MATAQTAPLTADELLAMPDDCRRHELVAGVLKTMTPVGGRRGAINMLLMRPLCLIASLALLATPATPALAQLAAPAADTLRLAGLQAPVEILRDRNGIDHIYAENEHDLFFAQGYAAARERLFQLELWRREATGTVAELLGPREVQRDIGLRLFKFRGDLQEELAHYHPRGATIIGAFVAGINARVAETERDPTLLPPEFALLGTTPGRWTPEVVISRHQGLLGNITQELAYGRAVAAVGAEAVKRVANFQPGEPDIALDSAVNGALLQADVLAVYNAFRGGRPRFTPADLAAEHRGDSATVRQLAAAADAASDAPDLDRQWREQHDVGSNNWVVSGDRMAGGRPLMANDPHRALAAPSLRSWVHLVAPGWNVIGGGEPSLPGVSIGHNEHGAWGLTVFNTDGEDLYVYETNPANALQYRYRGGWEAMTVLHDTIPVKGQAPAVVALRYTRHGPVVYEDTANHVAYAVRAAWREVGGAPYLASLRMDQARTWEEFREACRYSNIPGENMIWADTSGTIGWQAVGIAPVRRNWSGLVPVPGDGRYEWDGYLPMLEKPHATNPASGFIATANNNVIPAGYPHRDAVGWTWADPYRYQRVVEVLGANARFTMAHMTRLQTDYLSIPARTLVPLLARVRGGDDRVEQARQLLLGWDHVLAPESVAAGIYEAWVRQLGDGVDSLVIPDAARPFVRGVALSRAVELLLAPSPEFGADPVAGRDSLLVRALAGTVAVLMERLGPDMAGWQYGQEGYKHVRIRHLLGTLVSDSLRAQLEVGPLPRGGDAHTVGSTGGADNQASGATFRIIVDVGNWDATMGTNAPGQSGDPRSPHYRDLFAPWAQDEFFSVAFTRSAVERAAERRSVIVPAGTSAP